MLHSMHNGSDAGQASGWDPYVTEAAGPAPVVRLLGQRRLGQGGQAVTLLYRKGWALLAYLAIERRRHQRTHLASLFWPRLSETAGLTNLRQVLSDLNRALGDAGGSGMLRIDRESVELVGHRAAGLVDVDLLDPHAGVPVQGQDWLASAGELLEGLLLDGCEEYAEWLACAREWVNRRLEGLASALRDLAVEAGDLALARTLAQRLADQDPWNEAHHRTLMRLHLQAGQPALALLAYQRLCHRLKADLNELPSAETLQLAERIRQANGRLHGQRAFRAAMPLMELRA